MMEGHVTAKVITEAVMHRGAWLTREGVDSTPDGKNNFDQGGYVVDYKPCVRNGSKLVQLSIISGACAI